jgi:hypothetical protein
LNCLFLFFLLLAPYIHLNVLQDIQTLSVPPDDLVHS